jgi:hypothetical protein
MAKTYAARVMNALRPSGPIERAVLQKLVGILGDKSFNQTVDGLVKHGYIREQHGVLEATSKFLSDEDAFPGWANSTPASTTNTTVVSPQARRLWRAELENERHGGVSPATLESALDSLEQWPIDDDFFPTPEAKEAVRQELLSLAAKHGRKSTLDSLELDSTGTGALQGPGSPKA